MAYDTENLLLEADPGRTGMRPDIPLAQGLSQAFADMIACARAQASQIANDPIRAVHEYRKAIRRARALVRLIHDVLDAEVYAELSRALRDVHRATSELRDRHVLVRTLDSLEPGDEERALVAAVRSTITAQEPAPVEAVQMILDQGSADLEPLPVLLAGALPAKVRWRELGDGLRDTYRRTRRAMYEAFYNSDEEAIHQWRKRNKELVYQIEALQTESVQGESTQVEPMGSAGKKLRKLHKRLARQSSDLGRVIDLMVLRQYVRKHTSDEDKGTLFQLIARAQTGLIRTAFDRGEKYVDAPAKRLIAAIVKDVRHGHQRARRARRQIMHHGRA